MRKTNIYVLMTSILILLLVPFSNLDGLVVSNATLANSGTISYSPGSNLSYTIYQSGGVSYIQNSTGYIVYSNANANLAFSYAFSLVARGGSITVQAGTYTADTTSILMQNCNNVRVTFQTGSLLTITNWANVPVFQMKNDTNCLISGITIDGNGANQNPFWGAIGVDMWDCSNCLVTNANITNCATYGFVTWDSVTGHLPNGITNSIITYCHHNGICLGTSYGLYTKGAYAVNNTIAYSSDVGITCYGQGNYVANNYLHDMTTTNGAENSFYGIAVEGNGYNLIEQNTLVNCPVGIILGTGTPPTGYTYKGNLVRNNNLANCNTGIVLADNGYNTITQNQITNWLSGGVNYTFGIRNTAGPNNIISFNTLINTGVVSGYGQSAIFLGNAGTTANDKSNCSICNNTITTQLAVQDYGILLGGGSNNTIVEGNSIQAYTGIYIGTGISGYGSNGVCYNNRLNENNFANCTKQITDQGINTLILAPSNTSILTLNCPSINGAITPLAGSYLESNSSQVTITLTPDSNYNSVLNVDGVNVTLTDNTYTLSMNRDHVVYAIFSTSE